ncbi:MAG: hypothetical protein JXA57_01235 [Armatimonadetes bacterium]|nr:hypothetical protein [Armatimonadota bacterium]
MDEHQSSAREAGGSSSHGREARAILLVGLLLMGVAWVGTARFREHALAPAFPYAFVLGVLSVAFAAYVRFRRPARNERSRVGLWEYAGALLSLCSYLLLIQVLTAASPVRVVQYFAASSLCVLLGLIIPDIASKGVKGALRAAGATALTGAPLYIGLLLFSLGQTAEGRWEGELFGESCDALLQYAGLGLGLLGIILLDKREEHAKGK